MLTSYIAQDEFYKFVIDRRSGLRIVFTSQEMMERKGQVEPLWHREAGDQRSFEALIRWAGVRRAKWQIWGELAETIGRDAFYQHMRDLMAAEPVVECTGTVVQRQEDPCELVMGEMMHGITGIQVEELYRHRFASPQARDSFYDWFFTDRNCGLAAALLQIGYSHGTSALGDALDEIAAQGGKPLSRAERRRRAKRAAKAA